ncbi:iron chelate uptake ABC transporter, FeCT family, permease protein [Pseudoflavonifractor capillosus ATCC 29799]|uniref:Iron chelate uptake ABC transporter, FeCT family, permease protein n=2 Tax=Pseudoflavonifractor capillosus TaxID=106588 RepID=A6NSV2_9FIRM|nr:iron chelate uptake ABC transporter, FeCT family, permease protein [Pseudoflavonifractor capillosus ATCC 29799]
MRMPRIILAILTGAGLGMSGAAFQGLFSNPLATPDTLGVAAGASFGAALGILLGLDGAAIQLMAFGLGLAAVAAVYLIGGTRKDGSLVMIVLSGLVVSALFQALVSGVKYIADPQDQLPAITFWLMGSLSTASYEEVRIGAPMVLAGMLALFLLRWRINALTLQEDEARALGIPVRKLRALVILASTLVTASVVSMCGQVSWVGLLVPHVARMLLGNNHRHVVPACFFIGAIFMILIDTLARTLTAAEIPISILTAVIGAPMFIVLLRRTGGLRE